MKDEIVYEDSNLKPIDREQIELIHKDFENRGIGSHILEALDMLQEMRQSGEFCCIDILSDYDFVWDIHYVHENWANEQGHIKRKWCSHSDHRLDDAIRHLHEAWKDGKLDEGIAIKSPKRRQTVRRGHDHGD